MSDDSENSEDPQNAGESNRLGLVDRAPSANDVGGSPFRFSLRSLLVAMAVIACIAAASAEIGRRIADHERRNEQSRRHAKRAATIHKSFGAIALGLRLYGGVYVFNRPEYKTDRPWPPPTPANNSGQPLNSWRLQLCPSIPVMEYPPRDNFDLLEAWDAPINLGYAKDLGSFFSFDYEYKDTKTHVFGITGPDSAFDGAALSRYADLPENIVVAMEIRDSKTECFEPGDYNVADLLAHRGNIGDHLHGLLPDRLHVLFADGEVWALSPDAPMSALQPFLTITGAKSHDRDQLLAPHRLD